MASDKGASIFQRHLVFSRIREKSPTVLDVRLARAKKMAEREETERQGAEKKKGSTDSRGAVIEKQWSILPVIVFDRRYVTGLSDFSTPFTKYLGVTLNL